MSIPPNPLIELAERVERLTGPCRETDALIWCAIEPSYTHRKSHPEKAPSFTASLDAMTLVPEGFVWTVSKLGNGKFWASVAHPDGDCGFPVEKPTVTPSAALTASALRARAASEAIPPWPVR